MEKKKAWVWFKRGSWVSGFTATPCEEGGIVIEHADFVRCRVPDWRVTFKEPVDNKKAPLIPKDVIWKY